MIVFTAGVGENSVPIRSLVCEKLSCLGVKIDSSKVKLLENKLKLVLMILR